MGFLDKAKKLAEQAKEAAEGALNEVKARTNTGPGAQGPPGSGGSISFGGTQGVTWSSGAGTAPEGYSAPGGAGGSWGGGAGLGTAYTPGMLGRPGWRERGLTDPAAILPIAARDRAGVPHTTKSQIIEEPYGMGRRWSAGERTAALFYQLYPEQQAWQPPGGTTPAPELGGATVGTLGDGRSLVFLGHGDQRVVVELKGFDDTGRAELIRAVAAQLN